MLGVAPADHYAWRSRSPSPRAVADRALLRRIRTIHAASQGTYGVPRIHAELEDEGVSVGRKRIARLMRGAGLAGVCRRRRPRTHRARAFGPAGAGLVERCSAAEGPDRLWIADISYVPTPAGFLYLAVVLDAFSRRIVGWAMASHLRASAQCPVGDSWDRTPEDPHAASFPSTRLWFPLRHAAGARAKWGRDN